jgi:hypothetical protein
MSLFLRIPAYIGSEKESEGGAMKLGMSLLIIAALSCVGLTSPARLCGQSSRYKMIDLGTYGPTAPDRAGETGGSSAAANTGASDFPYVIRKTSITSIIEPLREKKGGGGGPSPSPQCTLMGHPCAPQIRCCPGLVCVFHGGSTRVGYMCLP